MEEVPSAKRGNPKTVSIVVGALFILVVGVGGYLIFGKQLFQPQGQSSTDSVATRENADTNKGVVASIQEALASSQSLQCAFTDDEGRTVISYIKSGRVRTDIEAKDPKQSGSMIYTDSTMYFWNGKNGTKMTFDMSKALSQVTPSETETSQQNPNEIVAAMEKYRESCRQANVDETLFEVPSEVTFTDVSSMMEGVKAAMPSGVMPSGISEDQIKAMQEKYQQ